jgi:hypothetical protein
MQNFYNETGDALIERTLAKNAHKNAVDSHMDESIRLRVGYDEKLSNVLAVMLKICCRMWERNSLDHDANFLKCELKETLSTLANALDIQDETLLEAVYRQVDREYFDNPLAVLPCSSTIPITSSFVAASQHEFHKLNSTEVALHKDAPNIIK